MKTFRQFFLILMGSIPLMVLGACGQGGNFFAFDFLSRANLDVRGGEEGDPNVEITGIDVDIDETTDDGSDGTDDGSDTTDDGSTDDPTDDTTDDGSTDDPTDDTGSDDTTDDGSDDDPIIDEDEEDREDSDPVDEENCENDADCDGFDDDEDNLPGACIDMQVVSEGVSSAYVNLCGSSVFTPDDFKNGDFTRTRRVNLADGCDLQVGYSLAGSPGDCLTIRLFNCSMDPVEQLYEKKLCRDTGAPERN